MYIYMKVDYNELKIRRCQCIIDPATATLVGGAMSSGVNALGSLLGFGSSNKTNKTNLRIAQMNNEFNERMLQKQMDYNTEMWNKENEYNTAANQRKRLEEAGLNPYLMMNGGSAGTASSAQGVTPPTASDAGRQQAWNPDFSGIGNSIQTAVQQYNQRQVDLANINRSNEETNGIKIENQYKAAMNIAKIAEIAANTKDKNAQASLHDIQYRLQNETFNSDVQYKQHQAQQMKFTALAQRIDYLYKQKELQTYDKRFQYEMAQIMANISLMYAQGELTKEQAEHEVQKRLETEARTRGIKLSNNQLRQLTPLVVRKAQLEVDNYGFDTPTGALWQLSGRLVPSVDNFFNGVVKGYNAYRKGWNEYKDKMKSKFRRDFHIPGVLFDSF